MLKFADLYIDTGFFKINKENITFYDETNISTIRKKKKKQTRFQRKNGFGKR